MSKIVLMAKLLSHTVSQKCDGQRNKQNTKTSTFSDPNGGMRSPSPTKLGMVIEETRTILATTFWELDV